MRSQSVSQKVALLQWAGPYEDRRFVDRMGRPRMLRLRGKNSISTLVKNANIELSANEVIAILERYGNVRRVPGRGYELVNTFFASNAQENVAFEPIAYFLADASATLDRILNYRGKGQNPIHFWRKVESLNLSEGLARQFSIFSKERSLAFLEELDDWLDAHTTRARKASKPHRVGIGVFSIYSNTNSNRLSTSER